MKGMSNTNSILKISSIGIVVKKLKKMPKLNKGHNCVEIRQVIYFSAQKVSQILKLLPLTFEISCTQSYVFSTFEKGA